MVEQGRDIAEFNDAMGYITRINLLFAKADTYSGILDVFNLFHALMCLHRELSMMITTKEIEGLEKKRRALAQEVNNYTRNPRLALSGKLSDSLYNQLHEYEIELRKIYKDSGLAMRFQEDARNALR